MGAIRGTSATLTMSELHAANDLNNMVPLPSSELQAVKPTSPQNPEMHTGGCRE